MPAVGYFPCIFNHLPTKESGIFLIQRMLGGMNLEFAKEIENGYWLELIIRSWCNNLAVENSVIEGYEIIHGSLLYDIINLLNRVTYSNLDMKLIMSLKSEKDKH